jgi:hypothetical protein
MGPFGNAGSQARVWPVRRELLVPKRLGIRHGQSPADAEIGRLDRAPPNPTKIATCSRIPHEFGIRHAQAADTIPRVAQRVMNESSSRVDQLMVESRSADSLTI